MATMGLFTDPAQLQEARLMQQAQMDPNQRLYMMAARGGQQLGQGIGSLFGVDVQDPAVKAATKLRELGAKYGTTTADALDKIAADPSMDEFPQLRLEVAQKANEMRKSVVDLQAKQAETQAKLREALSPEQKNAQALADASGAERGTTEWNRIYKKELTSLTSKEERLTSFGRTLTEAGITEGSPEFQRLSKQFAEATLKSQAEGKGTKVYNTIEGIDKAISAVVGKGTGEEISALGKNVSGLSKFERAVSEVETLLPNSFTGLGSGALTQLNKAASAVGLSKGEKASNTEILTNTFNNIVLPMARQLPGSLAAKELTFLLTTKPATEQEMPTIRRLIRQMLQDYRDDKATYDLAQKHASKNKGSYVGFDINSARYNVGRRTDLENRVRAGTASVAEAEELKKLRSEMQ